MKTTVKELDYEKVMALPQYPHLHPIRPGIFWRTLVRGLSILGLAGTHFHYTSEGMEKVGKNEPCLILMNHSCFLDLQIASAILYPRPYNIICTSDGFVGMGGLMAWAMRTIGCVPTRKFVTDLTLVQDMVYCLKDLKSSVLMYPEASYSFDGTCTALPRKMGVLLKKLDVPVVMIMWCILVQYVTPIHQAVGHLEIFWSRVPIFFIGINMGEMVRQKQTLDGASIWMIWLMFLMTLLASIFLEQEKHGMFPLFLERMLYIPLTITSILLLNRIFRRTPSWFNKGFMFVGALSLECYLLHIHFVLKYLEPHHLGYWPTFFLCIGITLPAAWILSKIAGWISKELAKFIK